ncbi:hypothetical protein Cs7R123_48390 [Catellatospora sp. TT07R-123]|uniref:DUF4255 domain-containing protein n=1 Tax=Catellatospora sp. TT07R-123 TaxID=2733863 RepID=UPI001B0D1E73|nr:DUF4255 domain-containing protein [Catellatospora sp. TT07R-123]GHJ47497.1 hypothetical protein Cs7R123_48390 [Catellatospora sp. TT07R-123]
MYDLSIVTDALKQIIIDALAASPLFGGGPPGFSTAVSGQHPQHPSLADCDLNLYLFHVTENKHLKNAFWSQSMLTGQPPGPPRQPVAYEPLCLDLYFLLSAESQTSYTHEQQAMSVAMRALHEYGTLQLATPTPTGQPASEVSITLESPTPDELSRLWQALTVPMRMSAQYRVGVAMLMPRTGLTEQPPPVQWTLLGGPTGGADAGIRPVLYGTSRHVRLTTPTGPSGYDQTPATAGPGQQFLLRGRNLADTDVVYLVEYTGGGEVETDVTATWRQPLPTPYPAVPADGVPFLLQVPAAAPPPGRYGLRAGRPSEPGYRSGTVPFGVAPVVDPDGGPLVAASGGVYTATVHNVPATGAQVRLGTAPLRQIGSGTPAAGQWHLSGTTLTFAAPAGLVPGRYAVHVRAADIEAQPALWAVVP